LPDVFRRNSALSRITTVSQQPKIGGTSCEVLGS
jgi:hypothetical protein